MNNLASSLVKLTVFAGGAVLGTLLFNWLEELLAERAEEQFERDRMRYEQGLAPIVSISPVEEQQD